MTPEQAGRMIRVAMHIQEVPPEKYNHRWWLSHGGEALTILDPVADLNECGTAGCAIGWTAALYPSEWRVDKLRPHQMPVFREYSTGCPILDGADFYGIEEYESDDLFGSSGNTVNAFRSRVNQSGKEVGDAMLDVVRDYGYEHEVEEALAQRESL